MSFKINVGVGGLMVRLLDSQSEACGFESRQGADAVFLGERHFTQISSLHPGGNGYPAIDSGGSCQFVRVLAPVKWQLALYASREAENVSE